ncbi:uncharacterized protein OCT59_018553 [Rhizophagus irregularis]|nr:hypothetical protein OCT59_018553 [Rhizophagus irregularis]GBC42358.2 hypothetical protein GLOIN_2v1477433 [Rhizophagus irregularis DAOM 181602=DAOM 197198]CAG8720985.1 19362_t:CDS:2 [Rhizophagus irregularis]
MHEYKNDSDGPVSNISESSEQNESEGLGLSVSMIVCTFVDESIRHNIAASIHITLIDSKDLEKHDNFYEYIAEFGFEYIIQEMQLAIWPLGNSLEEVELKLKSNRLDRVIWTVEYDGIKYKALPDYDLEMAENYDLKMAEQARKTRTNGVKNKHLTNKKNKKK